MKRRTKRDLNWYICVDLTDHRLDVAELSLMERGAYESLRMASLEIPAGLPQDLAALCRIVGAADEQERAAVASVLAKRFTLAQDGLLHNERCDAEIARIQKKKTKARENGRAGGLARGCTKSSNRSTTATAPANNEGIKNEENKRNKGNEKRLVVSAPTQVVPAPPKEAEDVGADIDDAANLSQLPQDDVAPDWRERIHRNRLRRLLDPTFGEGARNEEEAAQQLRQHEMRGKSAVLRDYDSLGS